MLLPKRIPTVKSVNQEISKNKDKNDEIIILEDKIREYLKWYDENIVEGQINELYDGQIVRELKNLIDKVAIWYELKYPDYRVNKLIPFDTKGSSHDSGCNNKLFNFNNFIKRLPDNEKYYFGNLKYGNILYFSPGRFAHLHVSDDGVVLEAEGISSVSKSMIADDDLKGISLAEVLDLFKKKDIALPTWNEIEPQVLRAALWNNHKNGLFDSIMYEIMVRGGDIIGPRRAMLFANEFGRDISIPMRYGVSALESNINTFMAYYTIHGGDKDLQYYFDYFNSVRNGEDISQVSFERAMALLAGLGDNKEKNKTYVMSDNRYLEDKLKM